MRIVLAYIIRSQPPTTFGSVYLLVEGNPKKFSIHSFQSDLRLLRGINVNFLLCSKATTCLVLSFRKKAQNGHLHISCLFGACIWPLAYVHMPTTALCTYSVPPTPQGFQCWNDSPNCNEKLSHYCNVFSPNSSWLALTIQVFENRVNFDFTTFKSGQIQWNFGELNIHTHHSPNWMQFSVRETKLSHNFSLLGIHGLPPMSNVSQCRSGRFHHLYACDNRTLISRNTPTEPFFLAKAKSS